MPKLKRETRNATQGTTKDEHQELPKATEHIKKLFKAVLQQFPKSRLVCVESWELCQPGLPWTMTPAIWHQRSPAAPPCHDK